MELTIFISYGISKFNYYFKNDQLYFVDEIFDQFQYNEQTDKFDYDKTVQTFSGQYVFNQGFDYETLGHNRFENDELDPEQVLKEEATYYLKLLSTKYTQR